MIVVPGLASVQTRIGCFTASLLVLHPSTVSQVSTALRIILFGHASVTLSVTIKYTRWSALHYITEQGTRPRMAPEGG